MSVFVLLHGMMHEGLHYLHCEAPECIIHGDLKSSNGMYMLVSLLLNYMCAYICAGE